MNSPELDTSGPLSDTIRIASRFMCWSSGIGLLLWLPAFGMQIFRENPNDGSMWTVFVVVCVIGVAASWLLCIRPILLVLHETDHKQDVCLFLRAFRTDQSASQMRSWLKAALGSPFRLSGIRAPSQRAGLFMTFFSPLFTGLRYAGSHLFELEAQDRNWLARLLNSFQQARVVFIDVREVTPHVLDEIKLAWQVFGPSRCIFIVNDSQSVEKWKKWLIERLEWEQTFESGDQKILVWSDSQKPALPEFTNEVQSLISSVPEGTPNLSPGVIGFVKEKVGNRNLRTPFYAKENSLVFGSILGSYAIFIPVGMITPSLGLWIAGIAMLILQYLFWRAWIRRRRQQGLAERVNRPGTPPRKRLRSAGLLMFGYLVVAFVLPSLTLGAFRYSLTAAQWNQTLVELHWLRSLVHGYHMYYGEYPKPNHPTETVVIDGKPYPAGGAMMLYQVLADDGDSEIELGTHRAGPSKGQLGEHPLADKELLERYVRRMPDGRFLIVDPFGFPVQYRTTANTFEIESVKAAFPH